MPLGGEPWRCMALRASRLAACSAAIFGVTCRLEMQGWECGREWGLLPAVAGIAGSEGSSFSTKSSSCIKWWS